MLPCLTEKSTKRTKDRETLSNYLKFTDELADKIIDKDFLEICHMNSPDGIKSISNHLAAFI